MEGIPDNIVQVNFRPEENDRSVMTPERRQEIFDLADTMHQLQAFLKTAAIDEQMLVKIKTAMPVFTGSMYADLVGSTPVRWAESPEYFAWIAETFILPTFEEMELYKLFRDDIEAVEAEKVGDGFE